MVILRYFTHINIILRILTRYILIWATRIRFEGTIKVQFESSLQHKEVQKLQRTNNKHSKQVVENTKSKGNLIFLPSSII